jgi:hypothetical protein
VVMNLYPKTFNHFSHTMAFFIASLVRILPNKMGL